MTFGVSASVILPCFSKSKICNARLDSSHPSHVDLRRLVVFFAVGGLDDGVRFLVVCFFAAALRLGAAFLVGAPFLLDAPFLAAVAFFGEPAFLAGAAVFFFGARLASVAFVRGLDRRLVGAFFDVAFFVAFFLIVSLGLPDALANR